MIAFAEKHSQQRLLDEIKEREEDGDDWTEAIMDWDGLECERCGVLSVIKEVIKDEKDILLCACSDYEDNIYLMWTPKYPWATQTEAEKKIKTREDVKNLIMPYLEELLDKKDIPEFKYHEATNGG